MIRGTMLTLLRRSRLCALLLLALSPGLGGWALAEAHSCPAESAWALQEAATGGEHDHHHADDQAGGGDEHGEHEACQCLGSCCPAALQAPLGAREPISGPDRATTTGPLWDPGPPGFSWFPGDWLPPATAPPLP